MNQYISKDLSGNYGMPKGIYIVTNIYYSIRSVIHDEMVPGIYNSSFKNLDIAIEHVLEQMNEIGNEFTDTISIESSQNLTLTLSQIKVDKVKQLLLEEGEIIFRMEQIDPLESIIYNVFKINCIDLL